MKSVNTIYTNLRTQVGAYYEVQIVRNNVEYGNDRLKSVTIHSALYDGSGVSVGNAYSSYCKITVMEESGNWPRMAQFSIRVRLSDSSGSTKSGWVNMGTFYTDERSEDTYGNLSITGYDRMLMTEQYWTDKIPEQSGSTQWPVTCRAWVSLMESLDLIEVDPETEAELDNERLLIGINTASTIRDKLKDIAAIHGGNWVITPEGKLKLVYFHNIVDGQAAIAGIAITGVSVAGDDLIESAAGLDLNFLGMNVQRFENSPTLQAISRVHLETEGGVVSEYGDDPDGYMLTGSCEFANNIGPAELCWGNVKDYQYKPFAAEKALLDPAAEVGDLVIIDGRSYQMMAIDWNLSTWPTADISAPYDAEVDHEYTIISPEAKSYRKSVASTDEKLKDYAAIEEFGTLIEQNAESVVIAAEHTYVTQLVYNRQMEQIEDQIHGMINSYSGEDVPTLNNLPASQWQPDEYAQHVGNIYLVTSGQQEGQYYRFIQRGSNFGWEVISDSAMAEALQKAADAQTAAANAQQEAEDAAAAAREAKGTANEAAAAAVSEAAAAKAAALQAAAEDALEKANAALQAAREYADNQVKNFVEGRYKDDLEAVGHQLDQKAETYYQDYDPLADWPEGTEEEHTGDLWYNTSDQKYYRWDGVAWDEMTANPPSAVFDQIDGKAQIFITQPEPPYAAGDLWVQGETGDIFRCVKDRESGEFDWEDWGLASKYTDDSSLNLFISEQYSKMVEAIKSQLDQKAETFYQPDDPSLVFISSLMRNINKWDTRAGVAIAGINIVGSSLEGHKGDLWYDTDDDTTHYWDGAQWVEQTIPKELFDTFDGKAQIFVSQPSDADDYYEPGDLWVNATYSGQKQTGETVSYSNEILRCIQSKEKGDPFLIDHWQKASKYTDDSALQSFVESVYNPAIQSIGIELDGKVDTYFYGYEPTAENLPYRKWIEDGVNLDDHIDDIFYNTATGFAYRFTKSGNTYAWVRIKDSDITAAMDAASNAKDTADGKRRVFVVEPKQADAYDIGDLWVNATYPANSTNPTYSNDLLRCKTPKAAGDAFSINDWEPASGYTNDDALNAYKETVTAEFETTAENINARVTRTGKNQAQSFEWSLTDEAHVWYKKVGNVKTEVLRIDGTGLHVNGDGTFSGTVSAATITGGTINIGNGNFQVSNTGQLTAKSGVFEGSVYAGSILSGSGHGYNYGYFDGSGISLGSITGGYDASYNPTGQLAFGVSQSLAYANKYNAATQNGTTDYPPFFTANTITALSSIYSQAVKYSASGDKEIDLVGHYHTITVTNGKVTIGAPANYTQAPSFDINDLISSITPVFGA